MNFYRPLKRLFDFAFAIALLVVASPIFMVIAVAIFTNDRKDVFYRGHRVGRDGRAFEMLKFRTMRVDADRIGPSSTSNDDPRITRVGRLLRATKLDELPQLWNVVRGEMSIVGPRPQVQWAVELYSNEEKRLLTVRPGITDYASIAFRNEGEILAGSTDPDADYLKLIAPRKIELGVYYVNNITFRSDLKIIAATVLAIFGKDPDWALPSWWRHSH